MKSSRKPQRSLGRFALSSALALIPERYRATLAVHLGRPDLRFSLLQLRQFGFMPKHVLDGGAYHGEWTAQCLEV